ncbi:MAG: hypothetical protein JWN70_6597 [Planctomycetaceae bacterium]|nr:hypothetical protein [Planctomycetaceae bacterium]
MQGWMDWFKLKRGPAVSVCQQTEVGTIRVDSGCLLFGDPSYVSELARIEGIPPGEHSVQALSVRYPGGFSRLAKIGIRFQPGTTDSQRSIGGIYVGSGMVVAVDSEDCQKYWTEVGPARIGHSSGKDSPRVAKLIEKRFGVKWVPHSIISMRSVQPISEQLEEQITAYLQTFPEFANYTFIDFSIRTENSCERVAASLNADAWSEVELDTTSHAALLAMSSGYGDGNYDLQGIFQGDKLLGMECEFFGAEMDEALIGVPALRY